MKIFLSDQQRNFPQLLAELIRLPVSDTSEVMLVNKKSSIEIAAGPLDKVNFDVLFDYRIFPPNIMSHLAVWTVEGREMRVGDTILQQVHVPPFRTVSQKIIFGVRVDRIIDEPGRKGFSYSTLEGHVETGTSIFTFESENGKNFFRIETFSAPGNLLSKLTGPFFARPYQGFCTKKALQYVKRQVFK
ncbi:MAG TPA: DUF1990 family protein [Cyclobacteriaceae bacterium]|nr:DUF1990 family protein [Cyclobacteriaceae bacterium]